MSRTAAETRAHVLRVAGNLFYGNGIRATGVDVVAAEAGVAPTTLYRLFGSKDELVGAYVEDTDRAFRALVEDAVAKAGPDPRAQIVAIFDAVYAEIASDQFRGCAMMMTLAEFPDAGLPGHRHAVADKAWFRARLGELTGAVTGRASGGVNGEANGELVGRLPAKGPAASEALADHLTLAFEGMLASGQALGPDGPAAQGPRLAEAILAGVVASDG